ncbi:MAG: EamA family transporter [Burkholderiales bacterium]
MLLFGSGIAGTAPAFPPPMAWMFKVLLTRGPQRTGHTSFDRALHRRSANFGAVAILGEPIGSAVLAYLLLGESFNAAQFSGFVVLIAGIFAAARGEKLRDSEGREV